MASFQALPWPEGVRYELDEGELGSTRLPTPFHNIVAGEIYIILSSFVDDNRLGCVFPPNTGYVLSHEKPPVRGPDVSFVNVARYRSINLSRDIEGAPDLAVEVVSPSETAADLHRKIRQYLAAGCQFVWEITRSAGFPDRNVAFVTAYLDRGQPSFKRTVAELAWNSFAWLVSEPDHIVVFHEGSASNTARLSEML